MLTDAGGKVPEGAAIAAQLGQEWALRFELNPDRGDSLVRIAGLPMDIEALGVTVAPTHPRGRVDALTLAVGGRRLEPGDLVRVTIPRLSGLDHATVILSGRTRVL